MCGGTPFISFTLPLQSMPNIMRVIRYSTEASPRAAVITVSVGSSQAISAAALCDKGCNKKQYCVRQTADTVAAAVGPFQQVQVQF